MPTRNINLTDHYDEFVSEQVGSGRFKNASEVMRAGLRLLEQRNREDAAKLKALRKLATEGFEALDRGAAVELDGDALGGYIARLGRRASRHAKVHRGG